MTLCDRIGLKDNGGIFYLFYYLQKNDKKVTDSVFVLWIQYFSP